MLPIPIKKETFEKSFLDGAGNLQLGTDQDAWSALWDSDGKFTRDVDKLADLSVDVGTGERALTLGQEQNVQMTVSAGAQAAGQIELVWPDEKDGNDLITTYGLAPFLTDDKLYMALVFNGSAQAGANANVPSGALSASLWAGAGGNAGYTRLKPYPQSQGARAILTDLFSGTRLPQRIDEVDEIPAAGEVVSLTHGGYLYLGASLNWGYTMNGAKSFEAGDLDLVFSYFVKMAASMSVNYKLAGQHTIQAWRGHDPSWVRFIVTKSRDSELGFAADFGLDAKVDLDGLPANVDDFLGALLGTDVRSALGYLEEAGKYDTLEKIEGALDSLATGFLQDLSDKWFEKALDDETVQEFFKTAQDVVNTYNSLDQKLIDIYERYIDDIPGLTDTINDLAQLTTREGLLAWVEGEVPADVKNNRAWEFVKDEWGDDFTDLLFDNDEFQKLSKLVGDAQAFLNGGVQEKISGFVSEVKGKLGIDGFMQKIETYSDPQALKAEADAKVQGFVSRVIGKSFDKIEDSELADVLAKLKAFRDKVQEIKEKWYGKLQQAAHQSVSLQVGYNYTRTKKSESLLDVEINLADGRGKELARAASKGDFAGALVAYDPTLVRVNPGSRLTQKLQKASQVQVNLFGHHFSRAVNIVQNLDQYVETEEGGGLVHVYSLDTAAEVVKQSDKESQKSSFLLQSVGASVQPEGADAPVDKQGRFLVQTLRNMAVKYEMNQEDQETTFDEMKCYLGLAEELRLVRSAADVNDQLRREFPNGLGKVKVDYVVRYNDDDVRSVFAAANTQQLDEARSAARHVIAKTFLSLGPHDNRFAIGAGYLSGAKEHFLGDGTVTVNVPSKYTGGPARSFGVKKAEKAIVRMLFNVEDSYVKRFKQLDGLVDRMRDGGKPVPIDELKKASLDFVVMNAKLEKRTPGNGSANVFFVIFDRLVRASGRPKSQSAMIVTITPPGAAEEEKVTKYFIHEGAQEAA